MINAARRLDELSTARVVCEAAEAVHKAQKGGQPIGTISPQMILVTREGIALDLMAPSSTAHMSPEKLKGQAGDRRSDVFSLGVVLWEALTHEKLFGGASEDAMKSAVLEREVQPPSELNANIPSELDAIVRKALARDPAERFPSTKVMAAELSTVLDDAGYPDDHSEIEKYLAAEFPAGVPIPTKLASTPAGSGPVKAPTAPARAQLNQTVLGMAPIKDPAELRALAERAAAERKAEDEAKAAEKALAEKATAKATADKAAADKATADKLAADKKTAEAKAAADKAAADKAAADKKAAEAKAAEAKTAADAKAAADKKAAEAKNAADAKAAADKKAAEAKAAAEKSAADRAAADKKAADARNEADKKAAEAKAAVERAAAAKAAADAAKTGVKTVQLGSNSQADLAAAVEAAKSSGAKTMQLGSNSQAEPAKPAEPAKSPISQAETLATPSLLTTIQGAAPSVLVAPAPAGATPSGIVGLPSMPPGASIPPFAEDDFATNSGAKAYQSIEDAVATSNAAPVAAAAVEPAAAKPMVPSPPTLPEAAQVVSLPRPRTPTEPGDAKRDQHASWFGSTDSHAAIEDHYEEDDPKKVRRKRLIIAIGSGVGALLLIAIIAMAAGGGKKKKEEAQPADKPEIAEGPSRTAANPGGDPVAKPTDPPQGSAAMTDPGTGSGSATIDPEAAKAEQARLEAEAAKQAAEKAEAAKAEQARLDAEAAKAEQARIEAQKKTELDAAKTDAERIAAQKKADAELAKAQKAEQAKTAAQAAKQAKIAAQQEAAEKAELAKERAAAAKQAKIAAQKEAAEKAAAEKAARIAAQPPKKDPPKKDPPKKDPPKKDPPRKDPKRVASTDGTPVDPYAAPKTDPASAYKAGFQQYVRGDTSGALATFKGAQQTSPGYAPTYRGLGLVYEKMGNKTAAKLAFKRYLQLSPNASDAEQIKDRVEKLGS